MKKIEEIVQCLKEKNDLDKQILNNQNKFGKLMSEVTKKDFVDYIGKCFSCTQMNVKQLFCIRDVNFLQYDSGIRIYCDCDNYEFCIPDFETSYLNMHFNQKLHFSNVEDFCEKFAGNEINTEEYEAKIQEYFKLIADQSYGKELSKILK